MSDDGMAEEKCEEYSEAGEDDNELLMESGCFM
jgi:hypothetical protein